MVLISKAEEIWDLDDKEFEDITVPEWKIDGEPVTVRLRVLEGHERDKYEQSLQRMVKGQPVPDMVNARARLVAWSAINESGERLFPGGQESVLRLGAKNSKALDRLWQAACRLSGIDFDGTLAEAEAENFGDDQSEPSISV